MSRPLHTQVTAHVATRQADVPAFLTEVQAAVAEHDVVVVGMHWNPHVPRARRALDAAGIAHHDLDHGNYLVGWRTRLHVKMWAGWPTFPMVFVKGTLVGGANSVEHLLADGSLQGLLSGTGSPAS